MQHFLLSTATDVSPLFSRAVAFYATTMNIEGFRAGLLTEPAIIAALFVFSAVVIISGVLAYRAGRQRGLLEAELSEAERMELSRKEAIERSRAVISGQISEQIAPWLPDFPVNPSDARFIGKPVDFVAFCGADEGLVREIVFIEVKTGRSTLTPVERSVREAITQGQVRWVEYRLE